MDFNFESAIMKPIPLYKFKSEGPPTEEVANQISIDAKKTPSTNKYSQNDDHILIPHEEKVGQHMARINNVNAQYDNKFHMYDMELEYKRLIDGDLPSTQDREKNSQ